MRPKWRKNTTNNNTVAAIGMLILSLQTVPQVIPQGNPSSTITNNNLIAGIQPTDNKFSMPMINKQSFDGDSTHVLCFIQQIKDTAKLLR